MEASRGILDASWGKCQKKVEGDHLLIGFLRTKVEQKSLKFAFKMQLAFPGVFKYIFVIFHVFESQLVKTCIIFSFLFCIDFLLIFC